MPYFLDGNCVRKGTKEEPGETVKCHDSHEKALAHLRALYVNVEDGGKAVEEDKGGPTSGWHAPPRGTHNAENAPNFAGGPGADREYGVERDPDEEEDDETRRCKCSKCGSVFVLPKGKQCHEMKCPQCGGSGAQEKPRRDKPAGGEEGKEPKPGRRKSVEVAEKEHRCVCPQCGKVVPVELGKPCNTVDCPSCGTRMTQKSPGEHPEGEKAAVGEPGPTVHGSGGSIGEHGAVVQDGERPNTCTCPQCGEEVPCAAAKCTHCGAKLVRQEAGGGEVDEEKSVWTVYKSNEGDWRWLAISSVGVRDREREVIERKAYMDAIDYARQKGAYGELDELHVQGTDVGDCDLMLLLPADGGDILLEGGSWHDTPAAVKAREAVAANPDRWGVSLKFRYNRALKRDGRYTGDIRILKRTILPKSMAASYGTAIVVQGGEAMSKALDDTTVEALRELGRSDEEIEELAESQKALPGDVVEKADGVVEKADGVVKKADGEVEKADAEAEEPEPEAEKEAEAEKEEVVTETVKRTVWQALKEAAESILKPKEQAPVASEPEEAGKGIEVAEAPANAADPADTSTGGGEAPAVEKAAGGHEEVMKALGETIATSLAGVFAEALKQRDQRIGALEETVKVLREEVAVANKTTEERVQERLRDLPKTVKIAATEVKATVDAISDLSEDEASKAAQKFMESVATAVSRLAGNPKVTI